MADVMGLFKVLVVVMLFYSFSITIIAYSIPSEALHYVDSFSELADDIDLQGTSSEIQNSLESQTNIPIIELGALVFYSGNIILDLLLNFAFAIPEMFALLIQGLLFLFNIDTFLVAQVQLFISVVTMALYFIGLIQLLTGIRSGRVA